jgi:hypothetical protein
VCTLTWLRREDGYELLFSRDEARTRLPAHPPALIRVGAVDVLAPRDADAGGTWLAINAWGLSVALLNGHPEGAQPPDPVSRGLLVLEMADAPHADEVAVRLRGRRLDVHRPFQLVALEPGAPLLQARWDGRRLELERLEDAAQPLCSSSLDPLGAGASRRELLARMLRHAGRVSEQLLIDFHASHEPQAGSLSPCMHREDAETVSFSRTRVTAGAVELGYTPQAPCLRRPLTWLGLERVPRPAGALPQPDAAARPAPAP